MSISPSRMLGASSRRKERPRSVFEPLLEATPLSSYTHLAPSIASATPLLRSQIPPSKIVPENCNIGGVSVATVNGDATNDDELAVQGRFFCGQDYDAIKAQFREVDDLFVDPFFPPSEAALFMNGEKDDSIVWMRPNELSDDPKFLLDTGSRFDVKQGELGDCWLLAAIANLTMNKHQFEKVVPIQQKFRKSKRYTGVFYFNFWYYGQWIEIVVDDLLPTRNGQLIYMKSQSKDEFWSALLEKAYAKLHGCYAALKGGLTVEAMVDFSGGCSEIFNLSEPPKELFTIMEKAFGRQSMMACSLEPDPRQFEAKTANGLVRGHAYSVTKVFRLDDGTPLLRIRNPWGNDTEWLGDWSDDSHKWDNISQKERDTIRFSDDGEFHMSLKDFLLNFDTLEQCHIGPDLLEDSQEPSLLNGGQFIWFESRADGRWRKGRSAGGCRNNIDTFALNPQYYVELRDSDQDEDDMCSVVISLMQKGSRGKKANTGCLTMGFSIYILPDSTTSAPTQPLDTKFFRYNSTTARSKTFINLREMTERFTLKPGHYVIVPCTFSPGEEGDFLIRVFSEASNKLTRLRDKPIE